MHIKGIILKAGLKEGNGTRPVVIDCSHIIDFDYTSCKVCKIFVFVSVYNKQRDIGKKIICIDLIGFISFFFNRFKLHFILII